MALKLTLKPGERAAINGAVIVNGDRRTELTIENRARVLRQSDIMQPQEATSPAKRVYLPIMMMALDPETGEEMRKEYEERLTEFTAAITDPGALSVCARLAAHVANGDHYKALMVCRELITFEHERLTHVS